MEESKCFGTIDQLKQLVESCGLTGGEWSKTHRVGYKMVCDGGTVLHWWFTTGRVTVQGVLSEMPVAAIAKLKEALAQVRRVA